MKTRMDKCTAVAVTGSSGLLGRYLVTQLEKSGREVIPVDLELGYDVLSMGDLSRIPPFGTLVHLAAKVYVPDSFKDSRAFYETNVMGTVNCLELCKKNGSGIVLASTYVYGSPQYLPVDEKHPASGWNPYATSKLLAEQLCTAYGEHFGVPSRILRFFNIYGPGQDDRFLIPTILRGLKQGRLTLKDAVPRRDFLFVADAARAIEACLSQDWNGTRIYNVGTGVSHSIAELVALARELVGGTGNVEFLNERRDCEIMDTVADISQIKNELDWEPAYDLKSGLSECLFEVQ
jgi:UDP-glucose 4-epimerase